MMLINNEDWLSVSDAAEFMGRSKAQVYKAIEQLPYTKTGRNYLIYRPKLEKMLEERDIEDIIPSKASWRRFTEYLQSCGKDRITLSISKIREISGSSSLTLHRPGEWDPKADRGTSSAYKAIIRAGYDIVQMRLGFLPEEGTNAITHITFEKSERDALEGLDLDGDKALAEQRGFLIPEYKKVFVRYNRPLRVAIVHLDQCYLVQNRPDWESRKHSEWTEYPTLKSAEMNCIREFGERWKYCLRCFRKE